MTLKDLTRLIWREIHRGNLLVIAGCIVCWIWFVMPIYKEIKGWLKGHDIATEYVVTDLEELRQEINALKNRSNIELKQTKAGQIGTTTH